MRSSTCAWIAGLVGAGLTSTSLLASDRFHLHDPGAESIVRYDAYGVFKGTGTSEYRYYVSDREALAQAVGEGIYPNVESLRADPAFRVWKSSAGAAENAWDLLHGGRLQRAFFAWASSHDQPSGIKQFYVAQVLENAGLYGQAIKAYQATVIHFPTAYAHTSWGTPWYVGPAALDTMRALIREHPELRMTLEGGRIRIGHRYDLNPRSESFEVDPGTIKPSSPAAPTTSFPAVSGGEPMGPLPVAAGDDGFSVIRTLGHGKVHLTQAINGHWQLWVNNRPYVVRGITYNATPVGKSPDDGTLVVHRDWMMADENKNGKIDGPCDSWVDKNRNNKRGRHERVVGDFRLLRDMGVNTIRLYHHEYNRKLLEGLFHSYGIRVLMGDLLGAYTVGSEAEWDTGTDYRDPVQRRNMLESVRQMVMEEKDEPYVLAWVLGNENNYGNANNSREFPDAFYSLVNEAARLIKSMDPDHPVALANGDFLFIDKAAALCPDVDIFGANAYRGRHGMGDSFWQDASELWGKPVLVTEFGCPAYHRFRSQAQAEALQAEFLKGNWCDIERNLADGPGVGNSLGGVLYEWMDEWWKAGTPPQFDPAAHDTVGQFPGPFPDGWSYEEWFGLVSQGDGSHSPYMRQLRPAYFLFKDDLWNPKKWKKRGLL